jgi:hypothetical protein
MSSSRSWSGPRGPATPSSSSATTTTRPSHRIRVVPVPHQTRFGAV